MEFSEAMSNARESMTAKHVYGEPYERDGVTVIPAAAVMGGGGGGSGDQPDGRTGWGGGFGVRARPAGAYVIRGGQVRWQPTIDLNRAILGCQLLGLAVIVLTHRRLMRRR